MEGVEWFLWGVKTGFSIIFLTFPLYFLTWPLALMTIISARTEYKRHGGGVISFFKATWFALKTLPRTANDLAKFLVTFIVQAYGLFSKTDAMGQLPQFMRRWLGYIGETKYVDRIVEKEKVVFRDGPAPPPRVPFKQRLWLRLKWAGIGGVTILLAEHFGWTLIKAIFSYLQR